MMQQTSTPTNNTTTPVTSSTILPTTEVSDEDEEDQECSEISVVDEKPQESCSSTVKDEDRNNNNNQGDSSDESCENGVEDGGVAKSSPQSTTPSSQQQNPSNNPHQHSQQPPPSMLPYLYGPAAAAALGLYSSTSALSHLSNIMFNAHHAHLMAADMPHLFNSSLIPPHPLWTQCNTADVNSLLGASSTTSTSSSPFHRSARFSPYPLLNLRNSTVNRSLSPERAPSNDSMESVANEPVSLTSKNPTSELKNIEKMVNGLHDQAKSSNRDSSV